MSSIARNQNGPVMAAVEKAGGKRNNRFREAEVAWRPRALPSRHGTRAPVRFAVLHEIFETQADLRPESVAVVCDRETTTYGDLERRANRLARHLRAR